MVVFTSTFMPMEAPTPTDGALPVTGVTEAPALTVPVEAFPAAMRTAPLPASTCAPVLPVPPCR